MPGTIKKQDRILGSFASLLSSALTIDGHSGVQPLKDSSGTLPRFVSPSIRTGTACFMMPTLMLKHKDSSRSSYGSIEEYAALNLARPLALTRDELEVAPLTLLGNLIDSFMSLVDSRKRSSLAALFRQSQTQKDSTLTRVLVSLLACSNDPITPSTVVTSFRVLQASERNSSGDVVMPLVLETVIDLKIFGSLVTISVVAPGTIQASFGPDGLITKAEIVLDTLSFLQSMMKQARYAVRKAVALSSTMATKLLGFSSSSNQKIPQLNMNSSVPSLSTLTDDQNVHELPVNAPYTQELEPVGNFSASSLMPPPPRRPSKRSIADLSTSCTATGASMQNSMWEEPSSGLSLLTTAAGLNQCRDEVLHKTARRQKLSQVPSVSAPKRVNSCPNQKTIS